MKQGLFANCPSTVDGPGEGHQREGDEMVPGAPGFPLRWAGTANANADGLSRIWAAFAGLSGFIPLPAPVSPFSR